MYQELQANWTPFNAERSSIFEWFSSIYADVISKDLFSFYCSDEMSQLLDFFVIVIVKTLQPKRLRQWMVVMRHELL